MATIGPAAGLVDRLRSTFNEYCKIQVGKARLMYDPSAPKMSQAQYLLVCQDCGILEPEGGEAAKEWHMHCKSEGSHRNGVLPSVMQYPSCTCNIPNSSTNAQHMQVTWVPRPSTSSSPPTSQSTSTSCPSSTLCGHCQRCPQPLAPTSTSWLLTWQATSPSTPTSHMSGRW